MVSLLLLVVYIAFSINKAKADTPTPTPPPHDIVIPNPPPEYDDTLESLVSGGSIGYDMTYVRIPQSDYTYGDTVVSFQNNAIYYNSWVEFSYISIPYIPTDNWRIDFMLYSENGYFTPQYIEYKGVRYDQTILELDTGAVFGVSYSSSTNSCKFSFVGSGPLGDENTTGFQNMVNDGSLTVYGDWHMSSPGMFYLDYFGYIYNDWNEIPSVYPERPTFPDVETDTPVPSDTPSYNGLFSAINNTLDWIGGVIQSGVGLIVGAIQDFFGDPAQIIAELDTIKDTFKPVQYIILGGTDEQGTAHIGLFSLGISAWDRLNALPSSAVLDFAGLKMDIAPVGNYTPSWITIGGSGFNHGESTHDSVVLGQGSYIVPPIHLDFGSMFNDLGLTGWIHLTIRLIAYGCVASYMWGLYQRTLHLVTGDTVRGLMIARSNGVI